ncbi:PREDICTED: probable multidrug resistance-associated protein lethal(2)03659 [Papilio polytes]|uniref:probable multidrug resistance-associated protein lethal(2)03659 n=1 Tax=Papilio polytes TaxID=76194 RepID=UPI00067637DA|nr:PREDICTED: probable multidrug resistance-associated protein lethal(2)03659 [Papilio polytes]
MESLKKKGKPPNPRAKANIFSALTFAWTLPIFWGGLKKEMEERDLYEPLEEHASSPLGDKFARLWEEEVARAGAKRTPSLLRVILKAYAARCMLYGFVLLFMECGIRIQQPRMLGSFVAYFGQIERRLMRRRVMILRDQTHMARQRFDNGTDKKIAQPVFLGKLIDFYGREQAAIKPVEAYLYAGAVILCSALNVFVVHPYMMAILHMGMKFRVACCSLIYRKSLRLSKTALGETTVGQVVNLLSNDVNRFDVAIIFLHYLWIGPLATVIIAYFMWLEISWAAVVGVGFMLAFIPLQAYFGKRTSELRLKTALRTDERVRLMNEILSGIQVIKMYTWEKPFADLVAKARKQEIKQIRATSYIRGVLTSFIMFMTRICLFISILAYVLGQNNIITAKQVFVVTSFYNILRQTMTVFFPQGIAQVAEATISIKRLQNFMLYEDTSKPVPGLSEIQTATKKKGKEEKEVRESVASTKDEPLVIEEKVQPEKLETEPEKKRDEARGNGNATLAPLESGEEDDEELAMRVEEDARGVRLKHATAKWIASHAENTLTDMSLTIKPGKLIAVIGPVGAGKSSLLHVLLRELPLLSGELHVGGTVSYASQEPWLFAGSVRQNILFGQAMDRPRYNAVVRRCALDRDFTLFPQGDKTVVGERGVSLSGGEFSTLFCKNKIYVPNKSSRKTKFPGRTCVVGYLRNTTRVLVTHQLQFLRDVDQIIILKNGSIAAAGEFETSNADLEDSLLQGSFRKRQMSIHSVSSVDNVSAAGMPEGAGGGREAAEARSAGAVAGAVYAAYLRAAGHPLLVALTLAVTALAQLLGSGSDWWTSYWVTLEEGLPPALLNTLSENATGPTLQLIDNETSPLVDNAQFPNSILDRYDCIYIYSAMVLSLVGMSLLRSFMFFWMAMSASTRLHNNMFAAITRAPMRFFHTNPSGRVLNRFSKDMGAVDEVLPSALLDVLQIGLSLIGIVVVVATVNWWLLVPTLAIGVIFYGLRIVYLSSSRSIKRLEGVTRSPVFSHLNASLQGITTIRAFGAQEALIREFDNHQDLHSSAWYLFIASSRAFGFWLDLVCVVYIAIVTLSFLVFDQLFRTDTLIQTTIRNKFAECTVLTIAHRLHTVMDSDKVLVMDAGQLVEFDHPHLLLQRSEGVLRSMVDQTGRAMADTLARVAQQAYESKYPAQSGTAVE